MREAAACTTMPSCFDKLSMRVKRIDLILSLSKDEAGTLDQ
jgi:hypothetical protein